MNRLSIASGRGRHVVASTVLTSPSIPADSLISKNLGTVMLDPRTSLVSCALRVGQIDEPAVPPQASDFSGAEGLHQRRFLQNTGTWTSISLDPVAQV